MKQLVIVLAAATVLLGCGVDRDGTRDNVVEGFEESGRVVDAECVDSVLDGYSDEQIEAIDDDRTSPESLALFEELLTCASVPT